jgi:hypothetical protein
MPCSVAVGWRWRQQGPPKCWYPAVTLLGVTAENTSTGIFTAMRTINLKSPLNLSLLHIYFFFLEQPHEKYCTCDLLKHRIDEYIQIFAMGAASPCRTILYVCTKFQALNPFSIHLWITFSWFANIEPYCLHWQVSLVHVQGSELCVTGMKILITDTQPGHISLFVCLFLCVYMTLVGF